MAGGDGGDATFRDWLVRARDVLRISPQQAISTWVVRKGLRISKDPPKPVPHFRKKAAVPQSGGAEVMPEARARAFARKTCLRLVERALAGEEVGAAELADAPVNLVAHDMPSDKEGGVKMFACVPCGLLAEAAFADPAARAATVVRNAKGVAPAGSEFFKPEWVEEGQPVTAVPNACWYVERTDGAPDEAWAPGAQKWAKPYALVVDVDGKNLVGEDASLYAEARARMETADGDGPGILRKLADVLVEELRLALPALAEGEVGVLVFASSGDKPSYRMYVRVASPGAHRTDALVFADIHDARSFVVDTFVPALETHEWYRDGLVDGATYSKGWDRAIGMAKLTKKTKEMRFLAPQPLEAPSWDRAVEGWRADPTAALLSCLGITYTADAPPVPRGTFNDLKKSRKRKSRDSLCSAGERAVREEGTDVVAELVTELLRRSLAAEDAEKLRFTSGATSVEFDGDGAPRAVKVTCASSNAFCPFRDLDVVDGPGARGGMLARSAREPHKKMAEGKVALFVSLADPFPEVRANCFSPKCRCTGPLFNLGTLVPEQKLRLLRVLSANM
jgi:hypothetical protein